MVYKRIGMVWLTVVAVTCLFAAPASAERFADLYIGISLAQDEDLKVSSGGVDRETEVSFDAGGTIGYRIGYFFPKAPAVAVALEGSYMGLKYGDDAEISMFALSPLVMARLNLKKSDVYPNGEWMPFVAAGPGFFLSKISYETSGSPVSEVIGSNVSGTYEDDRLDVGLDLRAGVKKMVAPKWAVNFEYRFVGWLSPKYEDNVLGNNVDTEIDLNIHNILIGVTYNF